MSIKRIHWSIVAFAASALLATTQVFGTQLLALDHGNQQLFQIDTTHLASPTLLGTINGGTDLFELRQDSTGKLYTFDRAANRILTISPTDAHVITSVPLDQDAFGSRRGFDFSSGGVLYGVLPGMQLRTINPSTGVTTFLTNITGAARTEAISFSPDGRLFASGSAGDDAASESLYQMNPTTGVLTLIGTTGVSDIDTLAFAPDGLLYGADSVDGVPGHLYTLNLLTAAATDLGFTGVPGLNGLAVIPEPATLWILTMSAGILLKGKRRQG